MVFPTFDLSLNFALRSSFYKPQSTPGLVFADCIERLNLWLQINIPTLGYGAAAERLNYPIKFSQCEGGNV